MTKKLFKSLKIGERFGPSQHSEASLVRIKKRPGKGSVPFYNALDMKTGLMVYIPVRRHIYSDGRKGKRK